MRSGNATAWAIGEKGTVIHLHGTDVKASGSGTGPRRACRARPPAASALPSVIQRVTA